MYENKVLSEKLSSNVKKLREHIKHLEQSLQEYTNFGGSDYDILKVFELVKKFFSEQGAKHVGEWKPTESSHHPFNNQIPAGDQGKAKDVVGMLSQ